MAKVFGLNLVDELACSIWAYSSCIIPVLVFYILNLKLGSNFGLVHQNSSTIPFCKSHNSVPNTQNLARRALQAQKVRHILKGLRKHAACHRTRWHRLRYGAVLLQLHKPDRIASYLSRVSDEAGTQAWLTETEQAGKL